MKSNNSQIQELLDILNTQDSGSNSLEAWFLGSKAENADKLEQLIVEALRDQAFWRRNYHPGDPSHITEQIKLQPEYIQAIASVKENFQSLLAFLKKSVPFFSMRYQGHMNWDITIPAILGYFGAMLYNPNNVAFEGSTATTLLEMWVGDDLCRMLGYTIPDESEIENGAIRPWGHITCGGTIANIEAIWSARNLKFYPIAFQAALKNESSLAAAKNIEISLPTGELKPLIKFDTWSLLNLRGDDILALPSRLTQEYEIDSEAIAQALSKYSLQNIGIQEFSRQFLRDIAASPVFLVPGTKHYSFPKAAAILGIGSSNIINVPIDKDARMSIPELEKILNECLAQKRPVYTVVAVIGSTEESAVDPIQEVLAVRDKFRSLGLEFTIHGDAAWGGYFAAMLREDDTKLPENPQSKQQPSAEVNLSAYVTQQFKALGNADSITVDPHKSGYIPYPAGALCYRNSAMRDMVTFKAPYISHGEAEPTIGIYGVEGSKPGAAAAAVYLSHRVIRPTKSGYGKIHGKAIFNCKKLYAKLLCMADPEDRFIIVPVPRLPAEINGDDVEEQIRFIRDRIDGKSNQEILADSEAMALLSEIGPDQNILTYAFNFKHPDGTLNTDLNLANRLNKTMYDQLSIKPGQDIYGYDLIVSTTDFDKADYGEVFVEDYKRRLGVRDSVSDSITVLRSTVMDPWLTETRKGSFLDTIEKEFREAVSQALFKDSILQVFEEIDVNKDGVLEMSEIESKFKELGYTEPEIKSFWKMSDVNRDGSLSKAEFFENFTQFLLSYQLKG
ncbi:MAG: decarboxylase [Okeania sp. SIO2C9]|uniref:pyridoxal-dependent decarboxylase n=1 Tax=Okeania sp. SIO2C9 TaxID=2607791 RepID=UPI0013C0BD1B|nr:pyridoxal-dependent decarboxylase [Okeania sp. SIO2C9]NEQ73817.1 decarboxylase [Okeania sp. SIO2C9]